MIPGYRPPTESISHEPAEAVTDPLTYGKGWYDDRYGVQGEIGDLAAHNIVRLNGYVVQLEAGKNGQLLVPAGATYAFATPGFAAVSSNAPPVQTIMVGVSLNPLPGATVAPGTISGAPASKSSALSPLEALFQMESPSDFFDLMSHLR